MSNYLLRVYLRHIWLFNVCKDYVSIFITLRGYNKMYILESINCLFGCSKEVHCDKITLHLTWSYSLYYHMLYTTLSVYLWKFLQSILSCVLFPFVVQTELCCFSMSFNIYLIFLKGMTSTYLCRPDTNIVAMY